MSTYSRADTRTQWFQDNFPGATTDPNVDVLHTTEGFDWPGYQGGATAPNYTAKPNIRDKKLNWRAHFPDEKSSRALRNTSGGVETNTLNCRQIELVGTCDPAHRFAWGSRKAGVDYIFWPDAPEWALDGLAHFLADGHKRHGIKLQAPKFLPYPKSFGSSDVRFTGSQWRNFYGICGHQHVPENVHGDPGDLDIQRVLEKARAIVAPAPAPKPKGPSFVGTLSVGHGNLFKDNTHKVEDVALLNNQRVHVFGLNEAARFRPILAAGITNYKVIQPQTGSASNNAILLRNDVEYLGEGSRKMCDKVGTSPQRDATWVLFKHLGRKWAHIQTHTNAHIELNGKPRNLPRVVQNIKHLANLTILVRELRAQGYRVTVAGDFNWAYRVGPVWQFAPRVVFRALGMYVNWQHPTAPAGGSLGARKIDYLAHDDADLRISGQKIITGEHSDHRWLRVDYRVVA